MRVILCTVFLLSWATSVLAQAPQFTRDSYKFITSVGATGTWDLTRLLASPVSGVSWKVTPNPTWVRLDSAQSKIYLLNNTRTSATAQLEVSNSEGRDSAEVTFVSASDLTWNTPAISFGTITEGQPFVFKLKEFVVNPDSRKMFFSFEGLPPWMTFDAPTGELRGTPTADHVGSFSGVKLTVDSSATRFKPAVVMGTGRVAAATPTPLPNDAPAFINDPQPLDPATINVDYRFDLSKFVKDPQGDPITYKKIVGPAWLSIEPNTGIITGKPTAAGNFTAVIEVSDGTAQNQGGLTGSVTDGNQAPVLNASALMFNMKERGTLSLDLNNPRYVTDDSPQLTFKFVAPERWATLTPEGKLELNPGFPQVGDQALKLEVSDGTLASTGYVRVKVDADPREPEWKADVKFAAQAGVEVRQDISGNAKDLDGRPIKFKRMAGPGWLDITQTGTLFGKPPNATTDQVFAIRVTNSAGLYVDGAVIVSMTPGNQPPIWKTPTTLKAARANVPYQDDLNAYITEPEGEKVTFGKVGGPAWIVVDPATGAVTGKPRPGDVGPNNVNLVATDERGASASIGALIQVGKPNAPPKWESQAEDIGQLPVGKQLNLALADKVKDEEGDPVTFRLVSGPAWVRLDATTGLVTGGPAATDPLGNFVLVVAASDGALESEAGFAGKVVPKNTPPAIDASMLTFDLDERKVLRVNLATIGAIKDSDAGDKLTCSMGTASWASLSTTCDLVLQPMYAQIGTQTLTFDVTDGKDVSAGTITVNVKRNPRPPHWKDDPITLAATADVKLQRNLNDFAEDFDAIPLTFRKVAGPGWLTVDVDGKMYGTPTDADGDESVFVIAAKNDKIEAEAGLVIQIESDNSKPIWKKNPVVLVNGKAGVLYSQSIKDFVTDPDPDETLTFKKISGPGWVYVLSGGRVFGPPEETDVGPVSIDVEVRDSRGARASAKVQFQVLSKNNPPVWTQETIPLGNAKVDTEFAFDLKPFAEDADKDQLTFRKLEGPGWMLVGTGGKVGGKPTVSDRGAFVGKFEVGDGKSWVPVDFFGDVQGGSGPPVLNEQNLVFAVGTGATLEIDLNQSQYVTDPEGDTLTFALLGCPPWASLSGSILKLQPTASHVGTHELSLRVTDSANGKDEGKIKVTVSDGPVEAPYWLSNPWEISIPPDVQFTLDLTDKVKDLKQYPITFKKLSGEAWLSVRSDGVVSGKPTAAMVGQLQVFEIESSNGFEKSKGTLEITVAGTVVGDAKDRFVLGKPVAGSPVEMLFLVDHNANTQAGYFTRMKADADGFFAELDRANLSYSVAVSSSRRYGPDMAVDRDGDWRLTSRDSNPAQAFREMIDNAYNNDPVHSPIWALKTLLNNSRSRPEIYLNDFYMPNVPLLVFIHSFDRDQFRAMQQGTISQGRSASEWSSTIANYVGTNLQKPILIFTNDSSCNPVYFEDYQQLASSTKSFAVKTSPCQPPFGNWLDGFAQQAIEQARLFMYPNLSLSQTPGRDKPVRVTLELDSGAKHALTGDTGAAPDKWHYESRRNEVVLHWWNFYNRYPGKPVAVIVEY